MPITNATYTFNFPAGKIKSVKINNENLRFAGLRSGNEIVFTGPDNLKLNRNELDLNVKLERSKRNKNYNIKIRKFKKTKSGSNYQFAVKRVFKRKYNLV